LFLAFDTTHKTEVKIIFARHVNAWEHGVITFPCNLIFPHWIEVKCSVWHSGRVAGDTRIYWQGGWEGRSAYLETLEEGNTYDCSHVHLVLNFLYRLSYPECHMLSVLLMLIINLVLCP